MEVKYFDPDSLYNLLGDDKNVIRSMLENLHKGILLKTDLLSAAFQAHDWNLIKTHSHSLKSNFRYLGCIELSTKLKKIEINADAEQRFDEIKEDFEQYLNTFPPILEEVTAYIEHIKST